MTPPRTHAIDRSCVGVFALLALVIAAAPARAEDPDDLSGASPPHVRPQTSEVRDLVAEAAERSATVRDMLDRLERSDVVVYIRHHVFSDSALEGRIGVLSTVGGQRYLVIELACVRIRTEQIATLGHELHHALEIAAEPSIVDTRSLAAHYERIGMRAPGRLSGQMFETAAARQTGLQVKREVFVKPAVTTEIPEED